MRKPVDLTEHFLLLSGRIEVIIDLSGIEGEVLVTNDAATPFPGGNSPDKFTSKVLKIVVEKKSTINLQIGNVLSE